MYDKLRKIREAKAEDDRGFTLIELLVVVVIIGILIAIAIPLYLNYQKGAHDKAAQSDLRGAVGIIQQCYTDNGNAYPAVVAQGGSGKDIPFDCGDGGTETVNVSSGTVMTYAIDTDGKGFTLTAYNDGGHRGSSNPYKYDSETAGQID